MLPWVLRLLGRRRRSASQGGNWLLLIRSPWNIISARTPPGRGRLFPYQKVWHPHGMRLRWMVNYVLSLYWIFFFFFIFLINCNLFLFVSSWQCCCLPLCVAATRFKDVFSEQDCRPREEAARPIISANACKIANICHCNSSNSCGRLWQNIEEVWQSVQKPNMLLGVFFMLHFC